MKWTTICLIAVLTLISIQGILYAGIGGYEPDNDPGPDDPGNPVNPLFAKAIFIFIALLFLFFLLPNWIRDKLAEKAEKEKANSTTEKTEKEKIAMETKQKARENQQLVVSRVGKDSKAEIMDIRKDDIITKVLGKDVKTVNQLRETLKNRYDNQLVTVELLRSGNVVVVETNFREDDQLGVFF